MVRVKNKAGPRDREREMIGPVELMQVNLRTCNSWLLVRGACIKSNYLTRGRSRTERSIRKECLVVVRRDTAGKDQ